MLQHSALAVDGIDQSQWFSHSLAVPVGTFTKVSHLVLRVIEWPPEKSLPEFGASIPALFEDHLSLVAEGTVMRSAIARFSKAVSTGSVMMLVDVPVFHAMAETGLQVAVYLRNVRAVFAAGTADWRDVTTCPPLFPFDFRSSCSSLSSTRLLSLLDLPSPIPLSRTPRAGPASRLHANATASSSSSSSSSAAPATARESFEDHKHSVQQQTTSPDAKPKAADACSNPESTGEFERLLMSNRMFVLSPSDLLPQKETAQHQHHQEQDEESD
jgi:hypothetical protein